MHYALLIRTDPEVAEALAPDDFVEIAASVDAFDARITIEGHNVASVRLGSGERVVRLRGGKPFTTDGPFTESKEQLGGIYLVDVEDLGAAEALAGELATARLGSIEIVPVAGLDLKAGVLHAPGGEGM